MKETKLNITWIKTITCFLQIEITGLIPIGNQLMKKSSKTFMKVFRYKEAKEKILSLQKVALILEIKSFKKMIRIAILNF